MIETRYELFENEAWINKSDFIKMIDVMILDVECCMINKEDAGYKKALENLRQIIIEELSIMELKR